MSRNSRSRRASRPGGARIGGARGTRRGHPPHDRALGALARGRRSPPRGRICSASGRAASVHAPRAPASSPAAARARPSSKWISCSGARGWRASPSDWGGVSAASRWLRAVATAPADEGFAGQTHPDRDIGSERDTLAAFPWMEPAALEVGERVGRAVELVEQGRVLDTQVVTRVDEVAMALEPRQPCTGGAFCRLSNWSSSYRTRPSVGSAANARRYERRAATGRRRTFASAMPRLRWTVGNDGSSRRARSHDAMASSYRRRS